MIRDLWLNVMPGMHDDLCQLEKSVYLLSALCVILLH